MMRKRDWKNVSKGRRGLMFIGFLALAAALVSLLGLVVMALWNALVPVIFGGPAIVWAQAIGLFALSRILFGGWGGGRHRGGGARWMGRRHMESLSPEERERMKELMRGRRCGPRDEEAATA